MAKKTYTQKSKDKKEIPVCAECLRDSKTSKDLTNEMFFWVLQHNENFPTLDHYGLYCIDCIDKFEMSIAKPYQKKRGRPKGSKNKKTDE
jgi:hypothetical protein